MEKMKFIVLDNVKKGNDIFSIEKHRLKQSIKELTISLEDSRSQGEIYQKECMAAVARELKLGGMYDRLKRDYKVSQKNLIDVTNSYGDFLSQVFEKKHQYMKKDDIESMYRICTVLDDNGWVEYNIAKVMLNQTVESLYPVESLMGVFEEADGIGMVRYLEKAIFGKIISTEKINCYELIRYSDPIRDEIYLEYREELKKLLILKFIHLSPSSFSNEILKSI